jgi:CheY-like chemotaxis protein
MASSADLANRSILVVEDEVIVAYDLVGIIEQAEGVVVGPAHCVKDGLSRLDNGPIDVALLDVNLNGELVFGLADALEERHIPFVFLSGHSKDMTPARHRGHCLLNKPCNAPGVVRALSEAIAESEAPVPEEKSSARLV